MVVFNKIKFSSKKLVIILSDKITNIINKGEITKRYYNPGNVFEEIHFLILNDDKPDTKKLQIMVGSAKIFIYNLVKPNFFLSLGYNHLLIKKYVSKCISIVKDINPNLVRSFNNFLDGYLAYKIYKTLKIPYVISLHGVWDKDCLYTIFHKARRNLLKKYEKISLTNSHAVIAVYKPIIRYARQYGARNINLIYNIVNYKKNFTYKVSNSKFRLITVNRQQIDKNPQKIIEAIEEIDCEYYLIGDGPFHKRLKKLTKKLNITHKVHFIKSMDNANLINFMTKFDVFISNTDVYGVSKGIIEASLLGLPIITNFFPEGSNMDLNENDFILCHNTKLGFKNAILTLKNNHELRKKYSLSSKNFAVKKFDPQIMENKTVNLYKQIVEKYRNV
ncbi:glycosyltransferase [Alphaproteobacteria bacterium]|nr:glycosyltransferase [Alphaproteobacteria bacterium]